MNEKSGQIKTPTWIILHGKHTVSVYDFRPAGVPLRHCWGHVADMLEIGFTALRDGPTLHLLPGESAEGRA